MLREDQQLLAAHFVALESAVLRLKIKEVWRHYAPDSRQNLYAVLAHWNAILWAVVLSLLAYDNDLIAHSASSS